jgi:hypothetical protein
MNKHKKIMELELPVAEAAEMTTMAAKEGVPIAEFLGIHVLSSAYGIFHPLVQAFRKRPKAGVCGTQTRQEEER